MQPEDAQNIVGANLFRQSEPALNVHRGPQKDAARDSAKDAASRTYGRPAISSEDERYARYDRAGQWDFGRSLKYNFGTNKPDEINWYLENRVGCKNTTHDGKNWIFTTGEGIIYIPDSERQNVVATGLTSPTVAKYYARFLRDQTVGVSFRYHGHDYGYSDMKQIADLFDNGSILVASGREGYAAATYLSTMDTLFDTMDMLQYPVDLLHMAALLYEAIHAINDMRGKPFYTIEDENTAFLFTAYYCRKNGMTANNFPPREGSARCIGTCILRCSICTII